jgi:hypothetical protein
MISVSTHGLDEVRRELQAMQQRARNLGPAWEEFLRWWTSTTEEQFSSRGRRWRTPWRPLAQSTRAEKRRKGWLSDPLVRTGDLRESITRRPLSIERIFADGLIAGTNASVAHFHHGGTKHMPARPLLNARRVAEEGAASSLVLSWILTGEPNIGGVPG